MGPKSKHQTIRQFFLRTIVGQATYVKFPLSKKEVKPVITHKSKEPTGIQPGSQTPEVVLIRILKSINSPLFLIRRKTHCRLLRSRAIHIKSVIPRNRE